MGNAKRVKVAILSGDIHDSNYYDTFIPSSISEWEEVDEDQVGSIRKGLERLSASANEEHREWSYRLVVLRLPQSGLVKQAIHAYDTLLAEEERKKAMIAKDRERHAKVVDIKKKARDLRKVIALLDPSKSELRHKLEEELRAMVEDINTAYKQTP